MEHEMKFLLIGQNGYVSSYLSQKLQIASLNRLDVSDLLNSKRAISNDYDIILFSLVDYSLDAMSSNYVNFELLREIYRKLTKNQILVYLSSLDTLNQNVNSCYLEHKRKAEKFCQEKGITIIRLTYPLGPNVPRRGMLRKIFEQLLNNETVVINDFHLRMVRLSNFADYLENEYIHLSGELNFAARNYTSLTNIVEIMKSKLYSKSKIISYRMKDSDPFEKCEFVIQSIDYANLICNQTEEWRRHWDAEKISNC